MIEPGEAETVFKAAEEETCNRSEHEINQPYDKKDLRVLEGLRGDHLPFARQFDAGDHVSKGGVLDEVDQFNAAAWEGAAEGLGKDDRADHFQFRKTESLGGQPLSFFYGSKSTAHIFGMIRRAAEGKAKDGSQKRGQINSNVGQSEIPDEELNHQRESTKEGNVCIGQPYDPGASIHAKRSHKNSERKSAQSRRNDQHHADFKPLHQGRQDVLLYENEFVHLMRISHLPLHPTLVRGRLIENLHRARSA